MNTIGDFLIACLIRPGVLALGPRGDEEVKGGLKGFLRVVGEINPAIPTRGSESTGGVVETLIGEPHG
jgi:hypothetical protein